MRRTGNPARRAASGGAALVQADAQHELVHQKRRPRHIARRLERENEREQDHDLRQEHDDTADARDNAVGDEALEPPVTKRCAHPCSQRGEAVLDPGHRRLGPREHRLKHQEQKRRQDEEPRDRMQHDAIDRAGQRVHRWLSEDCLTRDGPRLPLHGSQIGAAFGDVLSVPTLFVFDKAGKTAGVFYGAPPDLHDRVRRLVQRLLE